MNSGQTALATIDRSTREILAMTDLGELKDLALKARALEDVIRRSGKFTGTDYYRVANAALWAEWRGGQLLQESERIGGPGRGRIEKKSQAGNSFMALLDRTQLKKTTAYRWIAMAYAPESEVATYMAKQEATHKPIQRSDLVRLGEHCKPQDGARATRKREKLKAVEAMLRDGKSGESITKALHVSGSVIANVKRSLGMAVMDKSSTAVKQRREQMRQMAAEGHTSTQIAAALGFSEGGCRSAMRQAGIDVPADRVTSKLRHSSTLIAERIVMAASDLMSDVNLVVFADLDRSRIREWVQSLVSSRSALSVFIKRLSKEVGNNVEAA